MKQSFDDLPEMTPTQAKGLLSGEKCKTAKRISKQLKSEEELTSEPIVFYATKSERAISKRKVGLVSESKFIRHFLRENGYFDE